MGNETKGGFRQSVKRTWPTVAGFKDEKVIGQVIMGGLQKVTVIPGQKGNLSFTTARN